MLHNVEQLIKTFREIKTIQEKMKLFLAKTKDWSAQTPCFQDFFIGESKMLFFSKNETAVKFFKFPTIISRFIFAESVHTGPEIELHEKSFFPMKKTKNAEPKLTYNGHTKKRELTIVS